MKSSDPLSHFTAKPVVVLLSGGSQLWASSDPNQQFNTNSSKTEQSHFTNFNFTLTILDSHGHANTLVVINNPTIPINKAQKSGASVFMITPNTLIGKARKARAAPNIEQ